MWTMINSKRFINKNLMVFILFFAIFSKVAITVDPIKSPWPYVFSETFNLIVQSKAGTISTSGTHWYNWNIKSMQLDYSNSEVFHSCYQYIKTRTPCTIIYKNLEQSYIYFPQKRQCCYLGSEQSIPAPQDVAQDFIYNTTGKINQQTYYIWAINDQQQIINYYTTTNDKQITRRFYYPQVNTNYDYMLSSYNQKITNPTIFTIPSYCKKERPCSNSNEEYKDKVIINGFWHRLFKHKNIISS